MILKLLKSNNLILLCTNIDREYEQDEGTQRTGGPFGSRRPVLSGAGKK